MPEPWDQSTLTWGRTANRIWRSTCDRYEINAIIQPDGSYTYAAMHVRTPKHLIGLGLYAGLDSVTNAQAAKQACANHLDASHAVNH